MIRVTIERNRDSGTIEAFSVTGHAFYGKKGHDIVCAGVSAVTVGTVNAVERLTGVELPNEMRDGLLKVRIPEGTDEGRIGQIQLLLESMVVMLQSIEEAYGKYIVLQQA
ncbi:ribosomal-processing cysteine protease Prp [Paenibacillus flagellatus]|uniref:Ribosomal processing cysteine protease Prp n=1 Tax=Paenibacillus flagellatus TaxID=2211139 RepID=A0A2V5KSY1_9BACL|nr:ribosomal-processing cysteine protease Prp [Paenibacillus flagellatus]PYI52256.1 ribosomal-processing cysteine protease Prp [Paenibacillus flagellatus]